MNVLDPSTSQNGSSQLDKALGELNLKAFPFQKLIN